MIAAQWEERFKSWSQPPSETEAKKIENALTAVRKAVAADAKLGPVTKVFVQGSYRNRVNVRLESDVDIGVLYTDGLFGVSYPPNKGDNDFGLKDASYTCKHFKDDLHVALNNHFGKAHVTRGDKAFDIHENTYRVDTDVVPLIVHRRYSKDGSYICGTQLQPDSGGRIVNWPEKLFDEPEWREQHYENGNAKNKATARSYRGVVRILKKLRNAMADANVSAAKPLKGFFVECLVWNAPPYCFAQATWRDDVGAVLDFLVANTSSSDDCNEWGEVSELKYLFKDDEPKRLQAYNFAIAASKFLE